MASGNLSVKYAKFWLMNFFPCHLQYAAIYEGVRKPSEKAINDLLETYDFLEAFLSKTKFVAGDKMTIADISVLSTIAASRYMVPIDDKK